MRLPILLVICLVLTSASAAHARLFWQTYGSTTVADESGECHWNWNQDYFVPRHTSSCRYGLFSPCKTSRTNSAACVTCHPFYPGYCGIYSSCRYAWRNHVYQSYCGCTPVQGRCGPWQNGCRDSDCGQGNLVVMASAEPFGYLPNVEPQQFVILGSISAEGDGLLTDLDLMTQEESAIERSLGPNIEIPSQILQQLGLPQP